MLQQHFSLRKMTIALFAIVGLFSFSAQAQNSQEKRQSLSFEDELVEGATQKPELFFLFQKKNFNYKRLIRLRENFLPEMRQTSEDLQSGRSAN
jgi:hypothetical protein